MGKLASIEVYSSHGLLKGETEFLQALQAREDLFAERGEFVFGARRYLRIDLSREQLGLFEFFELKREGSVGYFSLCQMLIQAPF